MKEKFRYLFIDNFVKICFIASLLFLIPLVALVVFTIQNFPPMIPLFNSMPWGEERLAPSIALYAFPVVLVCIFIGNVVGAALLYKRYTLIARILLFNTALFLMLSTLAYLQILFLSF